MSKRMFGVLCHECLDGREPDHTDLTLAETEIQLHQYVLTHTQLTSHIKYEYGVLDVEEDS